MNAIAQGDPGRDVIGKLVARAFVAVIVTGVALAALTGRVGTANHVLDAVALAVAAFGSVCGVAVVVAVRLPHPIPDSPSNVFSAGSSGQGLAQGLAAMGLMVLYAAWLVPAGFGMARLTGGVRAAALAALLMLGAVPLVIGGHVAASFLRRHEPELVEALQPEHA